MSLQRAERIRGFFRDLKLALSGSDQDFTSGKLSRAIFLLSVPMVLEMIMESVFAVIDIFFVSRLGADAVAVVGITESMLTIVYAVGFGLATATTALVSRRIGEKDREGASRSAFQAIVAGAVVSLLISLPGLFYAGEMLKMMGLDEATATGMAGYTRIMLGGNIVIMLLFIINAVFRSSGDAAVSMRVLWMANLLNIVLDPLLIFGFGPIPALGIEGAAIATTTGRGLAVLYQFYLLTGGKKRIRLLWQQARISLPIILKLLRLSAGGIGQNLIATSSWIFLVRVIAEFGNEVVAGYTIAIRIIVFSLLPSFGIANAAATLVGQNLGAGKPGRAERSVWITGLVNIALLGSVCLLFLATPGIFIRFFTNEAAVVETGIQALRIISIGFIAYGLGMVLVNALNGAGDTFTPTWINFICFWMIEIPLSYLLAISLGYGETGAFYAIVIAETLLTVLAGFVFRRGRWKLRKV